MATRAPRHQRRTTSLTRTVRTSSSTTPACSNQTGSPGWIASRAAPISPMVSASAPILRAASLADLGQAYTFDKDPEFDPSHGLGHQAVRLCRSHRLHARPMAGRALSVSSRSGRLAVHPQRGWRYLGPPEVRFGVNYLMLRDDPRSADLAHARGDHGWPVAPHLRSAGTWPLSAPQPGGRHHHFSKFGLVYNSPLQQVMRASSGTTPTTGMRRRRPRFPSGSRSNILDRSARILTCFDLGGSDRGNHPECVRC